MPAFPPFRRRPGCRATATYFFAEFGPNTTTFVYPAEIFPVLTALFPAIGLSKTSGIVAGVSVLGLLATVTLLPEPKGISLEELTETRPRL